MASSAPGTVAGGGGGGGGAGAGGAPPPRSERPITTGGQRRGLSKANRLSQSFRNFRQGMKRGGSGVGNHNSSSGDLRAISSAGAALSPKGGSRGALPPPPSADSSDGGERKTGGSSAGGGAEEEKSLFERSRQQQLQAAVASNANDPEQRFQLAVASTLAFEKSLESLYWSASNVKKSVGTMIENLRLLLESARQLIAVEEDSFGLQNPELGARPGADSPGQVLVAALRDAANEAHGLCVRDFAQAFDRNHLLPLGQAKADFTQVHQMLNAREPMVQAAVHYKEKIDQLGHSRNRERMDRNREKLKDAIHDLEGHTNAIINKMTGLDSLRCRCLWNDLTHILKLVHDLLFELSNDVMHALDLAPQETPHTPMVRDSYLLSRDDERLSIITQITEVERNARTGPDPAATASAGADRTRSVALGHFFRHMTMPNVEKLLTDDFEFLVRYETFERTASEFQVFAQRSQDFITSVRAMFKASLLLTEDAVEMIRDDDDPIEIRHVRGFREVLLGLLGEMDRTVVAEVQNSFVRPVEAQAGSVDSVREEVQRRATALLENDHYKNKVATMHRRHKEDRMLRAQEKYMQAQEQVTLNTEMLLGKFEEVDTLRESILSENLAAMVRSVFGNMIRRMCAEFKKVREHWRSLDEGTSEAIGGGQDAMGGSPATAAAAAAAISTISPGANSNSAGAATAAAMAKMGSVRRLAPNASTNRMAEVGQQHAAVEMDSLYQNLKLAHLPEGVQNVVRSRLERSEDQRRQQRDIMMRNVTATLNEPRKKPTRDASQRPQQMGRATATEGMLAHAASAHNVGARFQQLQQQQMMQRPLDTTNAMVRYSEDLYNAFQDMELNIAGDGPLGMRIVKTMEISPVSGIRFSWATVSIIKRGQLAEAAGLQVGDIIVDAAGESLVRRPFSEVQNLIASAPRPLHLCIMRRIVPSVEYRQRHRECLQNSLRHLMPTGQAAGAVELMSPGTQEEQRWRQAEEQKRRKKEKPRPVSAAGPVAHMKPEDGGERDPRLSPSPIRPQSALPSNQGVSQEMRDKAMSILEGQDLPPPPDDTPPPETPPPPARTPGGTSTQPRRQGRRSRGSGSGSRGSGDGLGSNRSSPRSPGPPPPDSVAAIPLTGLSIESRGAGFGRGGGAGPGTAVPPPPMTPDTAASTKPRTVSELDSLRTPIQPVTTAGAARTVPTPISKVSGPLDPPPPTSADRPQVLRNPNRYYDTSYAVGEAHHRRKNSDASSFRDSLDRPSDPSGS